jgi:peptidoglycan/xylan/chitin deacetylase (PgdA/CDA1 family)
MRALSLEYHDVVVGIPDETGFPGAGPASYKLPAVEFERHLDAIATRTANVGRATDWVKAPIGAPPLFITFDDGGISAYTRIASALEKRGWRGHFFVTSGRIGTPTFVSPAQIRELHDRGHVIGSHSHSHPKRMGACRPADILEEWRRSIGVLSEILGEPIETASVPGGFYTRDVGEAAAQAGLKALFTSAPTTQLTSVAGCYVLGRYTLRRWSSAETAAAIAAWSWRPRMTQWALYSGLNLLRTVAGDHYTRVRQMFWARRSAG